MVARLLHNFWLKMFSLGLATMIWITVHIGITRDFSFTNPNLTHPSRQYVRYRFRSSRNRVTLAFTELRRSKLLQRSIGEEPILRRMSAKDIKIYVDLTDLRSKGVTNGELRADAPRDVTVVGLTPAAV